MITGVHHVCVKCRPEDLEKVQKFYGELLGLPLVRSWGAVSYTHLDHIHCLRWEVSRTAGLL